MPIRKMKGRFGVLEQRYKVRRAAASDSVHCQGVRSLRIGDQERQRAESREVERERTKLCACFHLLSDQRIQAIRKVSKNK